MTAVAAILIFFLTVVVHEFGHFFMAKLCNVKVIEFAVGMGPKIISKQKGETIYSFRAIPLGGFCQMEGEDEVASSERSLSRQKPWKKILILAMGPIMNFLLAVVLFAIVNLNTGLVTTTIDKILPQSPAAAVGIESGDRIIRVDQVEVKEWQDFALYVSNINQENIKPIEVTIQTPEKEERTVKLTPKFDAKQERVVIGVQAAVTKSFVKSIQYAFIQTFGIIILMFQFLGQLITGKIGTENVGGPVAVVQQIGEAANYGALALMKFSGFISINLGVFNLLPIPALDGSRILFALIEAIRRKPIAPEKEGFVHMIGFMLLLVLMVFVTYKDIARLFA